jgi:hypothetical protein
MPAHGEVISPDPLLGQPAQEQVGVRSAKVGVRDFEARKSRM